MFPNNLQIPTQFYLKIHPIQMVIHRSYQFPNVILYPTRPKETKKRNDAADASLKLICRFIEYYASICYAGFYAFQGFIF